VKEVDLMRIIKGGLIGALSFFLLSGVTQAVQFNPPSLVATEGEVRQFFAHYIERYNQRDRVGFLSLFSSKAILNQEDGLERIRKTYGGFFDQSKELRYRMQDIKIEIYQNAVEVEAHFVLDQIVKKGGKEKVFKGRIRWTLVREGGVLKILSLDNQPEKSS
jgi:hypothetical protein